MLAVNTTTNDVRTILRKTIQSGEYHLGAPLPSSRDLARQFGINRNTANKIYQELVAEGLIELASHRPPTVISPSSGSPGVGLRSEIRTTLWPLLHEGHLIGVHEGTMRTTIRQLVDEFFETYTPPRVLVTECNDEDVQRYADELTAALRVPVQPVLLHQLKNYAMSAAIVVAPHFHLEEAQAALGASKNLALGLIQTPDEANISQLVSQAHSGPIGIVAGNQAAVDRLKSVLQFYLQLPMVTATLDDAEDIKQLIRDVECIACTARCRKQLDDAGGGGKTVPIHYHVNPVSLEELRQRLVGVKESDAHISSDM